MPSALASPTALIAWPVQPPRFWCPLLASYQAHGNNSDIGKVFVNLLRIISCLLAALGIVLISWSSWFLSIWISPDFSHNYHKIFVMLIFAYTLFSMASPGYFIVFGFERPQVPAIITLGGAFLLLICIGILSPKWGLMGAALANLSYAVAILLNFYVAKRFWVEAFPVVFKAMWPPVFILLLELILSIFLIIDPLSTIVINFAAVIMLIWFALNEGRLYYILKVIRFA